MWTQAGGRKRSAQLRCIVSSSRVACLVERRRFTTGPPPRQPLRGEKHVRTVGLVYVVAFVVVLAAVRLQAGTEAPPAVAPPDPSAMAPVAESLPSTATEPIRANEAVGTVPAEAAQSEDPTRQTVAPPVPSRRKLPAAEP